MVKLIAEAFTNRQIAETLRVSEKTVESHRANVLAKLGMRDRVELARYAIRQRARRALSPRPGRRGARSLIGRAPHPRYPTSGVGIRIDVLHKGRVRRARHGPPRTRGGRRRGRRPVPISLGSIAEAEGLPLAYLEHLVRRLRNAELVESRRGAHGGYSLARPPEQISMAEVVEALEGEIAPIECITADCRRRARMRPRGRGALPHEAALDAGPGLDRPHAERDDARRPDHPPAPARRRPALHPKEKLTA